ncbi:MAG: diguanylate cyclase [Sporomusaceae bacterium]|nr:diguanylate cyclase [Sporomusaceae bacterium]
MMKLLIIDDEKSVRKILANMVGEWGYEVLFAADGISAWQIVQLIQEPLIVLLDWIIPGMDGIELCRKIKQNVKSGHVHVIMLTGQKNSVDDVVMGFEAGADDFLFKPIEPRELNCRLSVGKRILTYQYELEQRNHALEETTQIMERVMKALNSANSQLKELSLLDELTGIANRRHLETFFEKTWLHALNKQEEVTFMMADIDFFKLYNDTYGHQAGDECLKQVARALAECVTRPCDLLARYGGEEFGIILQNTSKVGAAELAKQIQEKLKALAIPHEGSPVSSQLTISLGVATAIPATNSSYEDLIQQADHALYRAKEEGRHQWIAF